MLEIEHRTYMIYLFPRKIKTFFLDNRSRRTATMRSAAYPSQSSGMRLALLSPPRMRRTSETMRAGSEPTRVFVPWAMVIGRFLLQLGVDLD